jgi:hypothetical protein
MDKLPELILPEDWKQRTRVFVIRTTPYGVMAPLVSKETYDADRWRTSLQAAKPSAEAARRIERFPVLVQLRPIRSRGKSPDLG